MSCRICTFEFYWCCGAKFNPFVLTHACDPNQVSKTLGPKSDYHELFLTRLSHSPTCVTEFIVFLILVELGVVLIQEILYNYGSKNTVLGTIFLLKGLYDWRMSLSTT